MKTAVTSIRILTGMLFIFSGLVEAIDPLGLAYKMQEFFEAWGQTQALTALMNGLDKYVVAFSIFMITLEVAVGMALLLGWQKKITTWILLLLMLFFTFLTSYVLFTGKIRACGCFGDCIPLTPIQTFSKDILLLIFTIVLVFSTKYILPVAKPWINTFYLVVVISLALLLQFHVMKHLPMFDCLPYRKGNNIVELSKMPANAVQDKFDFVFIYEKNGVKKEFPVSALPDSSWNYVDRIQKLVSKGSNNIPLITDFSLTTEEGGDATASILNEPGNYYLLFLKEVPSNADQWVEDCRKIILNASAAHRKIYVVTARKEIVNEFLSQHNLNVEGVLTSDVTTIKTAARAVPTIFLMHGPVIQGKWSWADFDQVEK